MSVLSSGAHRATPSDFRSSLLRMATAKEHLPQCQRLSHLDLQSVRLEGQRRIHSVLHLCISEEPYRISDTVLLCFREPDAYRRYLQLTPFWEPRRLAVATLYGKADR